MPWREEYDKAKENSQHQKAVIIMVFTNSAGAFLSPAHHKAQEIIYDC